MSKNKKKITEHFSFSRKTVLIVDDDPICRKLLQGILEKLGYQVFSAANGHEAYKILTDHFVGTNNNLLAIISDVMMPVADGITFLEDVKSNKNFAEVPFICVSSATDLVFINDAKRFGAEAFLKKPISKHQLKITLENIDLKQDAS